MEAYVISDNDNNIQRVVLLTEEQYKAIEWFIEEVAVNYNFSIGSPDNEAEVIR